MSFYPGSPYGFGGMPGYPRPMPTVQTQYSTSTQYTITQPFTGGGGLMPGYGQGLQFMPQSQMMMPGQQFGQVNPLLGGGQFGMPGQQQILLGQQPQLYAGGQMPFGGSQFGGGQFGIPGQQQILLGQQPQLYAGGQIPFGGSQFGGGQLGLQGLSSGGNNVPSIQQLGAQAFGQWPVGVYSPQARV